MTTSLLRLEAVKMQTGLSRSDIYRRVTAKTFPAPITIEGSRVRVWVSDSVDRWVAMQIQLNTNRQEA